MERLELPPDRASVPRARRFVRDLAADALEHDDLEIAELLTSELVTNAVLHSRTAFELRVGFRGDRLRVEVLDGSNDPPLLRQRIDPLALNGRGLQFVDKLARRWGVVADPPGKMVWFEV